MGCGKHPALTAAEEGINELSLSPKLTSADDGSRIHAANNVGADIMSFPLYPPFSFTQGDRRSYQPQSQDENNRLGGYMNLNCLKDEFPRVSETLYPEVSMSELCPATDGNDTIGADTENSRISKPRTIGEFSSSERSTSALPLVDNFGVTGDINDVKIVPAPTCSPQKVDGNFLTLGIGGDREIRSNSDLCIQEIASKLDDVASYHSNSSVPFPGFQMSRTNVGSNCFEKYHTSLFDPMPSSLPSESTLMAQPKYVTPTWLGTERTKPKCSSSQSTAPEQHYSRKNSMSISCESSRNYRPERHRGSSISHAQLGNLVPLTEGRTTRSSSGLQFPVSVRPGGSLTFPAEGTRTDIAEIGSSPSGIQPVGNFPTNNNIGSGEALGNSLYHQGNGFEISRAGSFHSDTTGPFPKRLGVQPNDLATARTIRGPAPYFPAQVNPCKPSVFPGQHWHDMPGQYSKDVTRVDCSTGQVLPFPKQDFRHQPPIVSHSSLKRQATESSPNARLGQRRRFVPQPIIHRFAPRQRPNIAVSIPTAAVHIPAAPDHVKWKGFDEPPKPTGHKCLLCKRDLSFTAEGPLYQPSVPPPVAVLSCGHTFHDHCLQLIIPQDQSKEPPCIPCVVGET